MLSIYVYNTIFTFRAAHMLLFIWLFLSHINDKVLEYTCIYTLYKYNFWRYLIKVIWFTIDSKWKHICACGDIST